MARSFINISLKLMLYGSFSVLDHFFWILINILPGISLISLINSRPWLHLNVFIKPNKRKIWSCRINWLLSTRSYRARMCSSCLSRSLTGRFLLDLIGVPNELFRYDKLMTVAKYLCVVVRSSWWKTINSRDNP